MGIVDWYLNWCDKWLPGYSRPEESDPDEKDQCARCEAEILVSATACPECGNCPYKSAKWSGIGIMLVGVILMIIPPVGIVVFLIGVLVRAGAGRLSPTDHDMGTA